MSQSKEVEEAFCHK